MGKVSAYPVLSVEMAKRGIDKKQIAQAADISYKAFYNKFYGIAPFTWDEVSAIRKKLFPDMASDSLFARS